MEAAPFAIDEEPTWIVVRDAALLVGVTAVDIKMTQVVSHCGVAITEPGGR